MLQHSSGENSKELLEVFQGSRPEVIINTGLSFPSLSPQAVLSPWSETFSPLPLHLSHPFSIASGPCFCASETFPKLVRSHSAVSILLFFTAPVYLDCNNVVIGNLKKNNVSLTWLLSAVRAGTTCVLFTAVSSVSSLRHDRQPKKIFMDWWMNGFLVWML